MRGDRTSETESLSASVRLARIIHSLAIARNLTAPSFLSHLLSQSIIIAAPTSAVRGGGLEPNFVDDVSRALPEGNRPTDQPPTKDG